jgi:hypothetical protein
MVDAGADKWRCSWLRVLATYWRECSVSRSDVKDYVYCANCALRTAHCELRVCHTLSTSIVREIAVSDNDDWKYWVTINQL